LEILVSGPVALNAPAEVGQTIGFTFSHRNIASRPAKAIYSALLPLGDRQQILVRPNILIPGIEIPRLLWRQKPT